MDRSIAIAITEAALSLPFDVGDTILYGKYKNKKGKIVSFGTNHKGQATVTIEPIPKGRKKNKELGLFKIWTSPTEATARGRPRLNKYDPGSLLGMVVYLLEEHGLDEAALKVRNVSRDVSRAWQEREKR